MTGTAVLQVVTQASRTVAFYLDSIMLDAQRLRCSEA